MPNKNSSITIKQASEFLSVSEKTLRRWEKKNILFPLRTIGGHRRYNLSDLIKIKNRYKSQKSRIFILPETKISDETGKNVFLKDYLKNEVEKLHQESLRQDQLQLYKSLPIVSKFQKYLVNSVFLLFTSLFSLYFITKFLPNTDFYNIEKAYIEGIKNKFLGTDTEEQIDTSKVLAASSFANVTFNINVESIFKRDATF